jgi:hypothetical protein
MVSACRSACHLVLLGAVALGAQATTLGEWLAARPAADLPTSASSHTLGTHTAPPALATTHAALPDPPTLALNGTPASASNLTHHRVRVRVRHHAPPHPPHPAHAARPQRPPPHTLASVQPLWNALRRLADPTSNTTNETVVSAMANPVDVVGETVALSTVAAANTAVNLRNLDPYDVCPSHCAPLALCLPHRPPL